MGEKSWKLLRKSSLRFGAKGCRAFVQEMSLNDTLIK